MKIRAEANVCHALSSGMGAVARGFEEETAVGSEITRPCRSSSSSSLEQQPPIAGEAQRS